MLFCLTVHHYVKHRGNFVKQAIVAALLIWFVLDTGLSITIGIYSHLIINCLTVTTILPPYYRHITAILPPYYRHYFC